MIFITAINLSLFVVAGSGLYLFSRVVKKKGYTAEKAKKYVLVVTSVAFCLMLAGQTIISYIANFGGAKSMKNGKGLADIMIYGWSIFVFFLCIAVLYKAYKNVEKAPEIKDRLET